MIVGNSIIERGLIKDAKIERLKNGTFDLTIGEIIPIGKNGLKLRRSPNGLKSYVIDPREMVWILSTEEFEMPKNVTGIATLRTALTQQGMLALNVGIIDSFFKGPISTALINFSDVPREIEVGMAFFRIVFFEHTDVTKFHKKDESRIGAQYLKDLERQSLNADFPQNFLNIPKLDDKYYSDIFGKLVWGWVKNNKKWSVGGAIIFAALFYYIWQDGFGVIVIAILAAVRDFVTQFRI